MPLTIQAIRALTIEQLLEAIIEEAVEIVYAASKARRYGLESKHPNKPDAKTNLMEVCLENVQIGNLIRELGARRGLNYGDLCELNQKAAEAQEREGITYDRPKG